MNVSRNRAHNRWTDVNESQPELLGWRESTLLSPLPSLLTSGSGNHTMSHHTSTSSGKDPGPNELEQLEELNRLQGLQLHPDQAEDDDDDCSLPSISTWPSSVQGPSAGRQVYDHTQLASGTSSMPSSSKRPGSSVGAPSVTGSDESGGKKPAAPSEISDSWRSHAVSTQASTLPAGSIKYVPPLAPPTPPSTSNPPIDQTGTTTPTASTSSTIGSTLPQPEHQRPPIHSTNKKHVTAIEAFNAHFGTQLTTFDSLQNMMSNNRMRAWYKSYKAQRAAESQVPPHFKAAGITPSEWMSTEALRQQRKKIRAEVSARSVDATRRYKEELARVRQEDKEHLSKHETQLVLAMEGGMDQLSPEVQEEVALKSGPQHAQELERQLASARAEWVKQAREGTLHFDPDAYPLMPL